MVIEKASFTVIGEPQAGSFVVRFFKFVRLHAQTKPYLYVFTCTYLKLEDYSLFIFVNIDITRD